MNGLNHMSAEAAMANSGRSRSKDFDDVTHPFNIWWQKHGQFMMSGGGRKQFIWACRGWIAREQLAEGVEVTGETEPEPISGEASPLCEHCGLPESKHEEWHDRSCCPGTHNLFKPAGGASTGEQPPSQMSNAEAELLGQRTETFYGSEKGDKLFPRHDPRCDVYIQKCCSCGLNPKSDGNVEPFGAFTECKHQHPRYMCKVPECASRPVSGTGSLPKEIQLAKGWLQRQLENVERDYVSWPDWMKAAVSGAEESAGRLTDIRDRYERSMSETAFTDAICAAYDLGKANAAAPSLTSRLPTVGELYTIACAHRGRVAEKKIAENRAYELTNWDMELVLGIHDWLKAQFFSSQEAGQ